jgi:hypothetical protein
VSSTCVRSLRDLDRHAVKLATAGCAAARWIETGTGADSYDAGGGFGRRANPASDFVLEAVKITKAAGFPLRSSGRAKMISAVVTIARCGMTAWSAALCHRGLAGPTIVGQSIFQGTFFEQFGIRTG